MKHGSCLKSVVVGITKYLRWSNLQATKVHFFTFLDAWESKVKAPTRLVFGRGCTIGRRRGKKG
jgi:hypothetical protein